MKKRIIVLLGSPGSGKGTQSELLSSSMNLFYFETSRILEDRFLFSSEDDFIEVDGEKFYTRDEKKLWETGSLCSPPFVTKLVLEKIKELHLQGKGIIFSGSPRTVYEGERVIPLIKDLYGKENIDVVLLQVSPEETIYRNSNRKICKLMRHSILYSEETKDLKFCPIDGSELMKREGLDDPETIKVRIKEFQERTMPLVDLFEKEGLKVNLINGSKSPAEVFNETLKAIGNDNN